MDESHVVIVEIKFNGLNRSRFNLSDITVEELTHYLHIKLNMKSVNVSIAK